MTCMCDCDVRLINFNLAVCCEMFNAWPPTSAPLHCISHDCVQGYGDISPDRPLSRMLVIAFIVATFVVIPYEVAKLVDAFASVSKYRAPYKFAGKTLHVVLAMSGGGRAGPGG